MAHHGSPFMKHASFRKGFHRRSAWHTRFQNHLQANRSKIGKLPVSERGPERGQNEVKTRSRNYSGHTNPPKRQNGPFLTPEVIVFIIVLLWFWSTCHMHAKHNGHTTNMVSLQHAGFVRNIAHTESMSSSFPQKLCMSNAKKIGHTTKHGVTSS